jgi:DNA-binding IclR family transcriptional regulator
MPVIARAAAILKAVGSARGGGVTTTAVARSAAIPRATAHRMLTALAEQGLIDRAPSTSLWFLGPEIYLLGSVATSRYDAAPVADDILRDLAEDTGESAFLSARRADESVCVSAVEGSFPLRSHVLYPGKRFPLGVASAGLVMLAHLSETESRDYLDRADLQQAWGSTHSRAAIERRIQQTRINGYAVNPGLVVEGSWGIGAAVFNALGQPQWALSVTGVQARIANDRTPLLGETLLRAAHVLTQRLERKS